MQISFLVFRQFTNLLQFILVVPKANAFLLPQALPLIQFPLIEKTVIEEQNHLHLMFSLHMFQVYSTEVLRKTSVLI